MDQDKKIDPDFLQKTKAELEAKRVQLIKELEELKSESGVGVKFQEYGDKMEENAQEVSEYLTDKATDKVLESSLRDIESALERIENGTYGICKYCGQEIALKRLEARPVASACVECKTKLQGA
jgi:DnaK suppressor protein